MMVYTGRNELYVLTHESSLAREALSVTRRTWA
jgi:hypothetical protein